MEPDRDFVLALLRHQSVQGPLQRATRPDNAYSLTLALILAPLVITGFISGRYLATIMPQKIFERFLLACTAIGALKLIW